MFATGSAELLPHMKQILQELGKPLNDMPSRISLSGHTDAKPYSAGERSYSNWELSADRANASRRQLVAAGLADGKVLRVVGLSSAALFDKADPLNPVNRRISIIVLTRKAEESMLKDTVPLPAPNEPPSAAASGAPVERTGEIDKPRSG
jgi:chemotaxis protein MotB